MYGPFFKLRKFETEFQLTSTPTGRTIRVKALQLPKTVTRFRVGRRGGVCCISSVCGEDDNDEASGSGIQVVRVLENSGMGSRKVLVLLRKSIVGLVRDGGMRLQWGECVYDTCRCCVIFLILLIIVHIYSCVQWIRYVWPSEPSSSPPVDSWRGMSRGLQCYFVTYQYSKVGINL